VAGCSTAAEEKNCDERCKNSEGKEAQLRVGQGGSPELLTVIHKTFARFFFARSDGFPAVEGQDPKRFRLTPSWAVIFQFYWCSLVALDSVLSVRVNLRNLRFTYDCRIRKTSLSNARGD